MPFPIPLGQRMAYDMDNTQVFLRLSEARGGAWEPVHPEAVRAMNSSNGAGMVVPFDAAADPWYRSEQEREYQFALIFPVPMRLTAIYAGFLKTAVVGQGLSTRTSYQYEPFAIYVSANTTNGIDGDWELLPTEFQSYSGDEYETAADTSAGSIYARNTPPLMPAVHALTGATINNVSNGEPNISPKMAHRYRRARDGRGQQEVFTRNVKGMRVVGDPPGRFTYDGTNRFAFVLHLYGFPDTDAEGRVLMAWHPTQDRRLPDGGLQWADAHPVSSSTRTFRIKNVSETETANDIVLSVEDERSAPTPSPASQLQLSLDGTSWAASVTLSSVGSDSVSPVVHVRRMTPGDSPLGSQSPRIRMIVGSWT